jgi:hypothetical protein
MRSEIVDPTLHRENADASASVPNRVQRESSRFFTLEEDDVIMRAQQSDPWESWQEIAKRVPGRTARQCSARWFNYLSPEIRSGPWTPEEDRLLVEKVKEMGQRWRVMTPFFNGRSVPDLSNRWRRLRSEIVDDGPDAGAASKHVNNCPKEASLSIVQEEREMEVVEARPMSSTPGRSVMHREPFAPATDAATIRTRTVCSYFVFENGLKTWTQHTPRRA